MADNELSTKERLLSLQNYVNSQIGENLPLTDGIKKLVKGDGANVTMTDNPDGGVDLTVDDQTRTLATEVEFSDVKAELSLLQQESDSTSDLDISDSEGYVLARFENGHIKTKNFDSSNIPQSSRIGVENTDVKSDLDITDGEGYVLARFEDGHIKTKFFNSAIINPVIVRVAKTGGDFSSIRYAVESIKDADAINKPYIIEVYEGVYDVLADYTDEEILSAGEEHYTDTSFVGVKLTDGISIKGVGSRNNIIIHGVLDINKFSSGVRNNISTLNTQGECFIDNVTVIGENIRYAVHDDFSDGFRQKNNRNPIRRLINCVFVDKHTTGGSAYGAGTGKARDYIINNCCFVGSLGIHSVGGMKHSNNIVVENCSGTSFTLGDQCTSNSDAVHNVVINNCNFDVIRPYKYSLEEQHINIAGVGNENAIINCPSYYVYETGNIYKVMKPLNKLDIVDDDFNTVTDSASAKGVCIGSVNGVAYVQKRGYISSDVLGLSDLSIGDYIGVSMGNIVKVTDVNNSIGIVKRIVSGTAFIKFNM